MVEDGWKDGWVLCDFTFFKRISVIPGRWVVTMKGCVQWNSVLWK